jgi:hypothetical protein
LYQLLAKDDDVTPKSWLISARSEEAAFRFACRRYLPGELWLGIEEYADFQEEAGAPPPAAGLTPQQSIAYLNAMTVDVFQSRLRASYYESHACGGESFRYWWLGEVQPDVADE